jgi:hypothetical protein
VSVPRAIADRVTILEKESIFQNKRVTVRENVGICTRIVRKMEDGSKQRSGGADGFSIFLRARGFYISTFRR